MIVRRTVTALLLAAALTVLTGELIPAPTEYVLRRIHELVSAERRATADAGIIVGDDGVPVVNYGPPLGRQWNPVAVSQIGLNHYRDIERGRIDAREQFLNCADWLVANRKCHAGYSTLDYEFVWDMYAMTPPWRSGMAQGRALEVMTRAHRLTQDDRYVETAREFLAAFFVEVDSGGVTYKSASGGWWYEEYARPGCVHSYVLNGMMFALLGIYDYYEYTGKTDIAAAMLFVKGVEAVAAALPEYDRRGDSDYDRLGSKAGPKYHAIHIRQLNELYKITDREVFRRYRDRWRRFQSFPLALRMVLSPTRAGVAVLGTHFIVLTIVLFVVLAMRGRFRSPQPA